MPLGRESIPAQRFENPFGGVLRTTDRFTVNTTFATVLGPVPSGRVYRVFNVDCTNLDTLTTAFKAITIQDNGAGHTFFFRTTRSVVVGDGRRFPDMPLTVGGNVHDFEIVPFHMEFDDIFQMGSTTIPTASGFTVKISYWDFRQ